jgi:hypothetical protein
VQDPYLKTQIQDFWYFKVDGTKKINATLSVPPLGFPFLHLQIGTYKDFYSLPNSEISSLLVGQYKRHVILSPNPGLKLLVINFKPYGFYNLFGKCPPSGKVDSIEGKDVFGANNLNQLITEIKTIEDDNQKFLLIENFMLANRTKNVKTYDYLDSVIDEVIKHNGLVPTSELIKNNCSVRTIQRYFSEVIGASPKTYSRILRHKYIIKLMYENPEIQWNDLIFRGYYFDHSHFNKDFFAFSSIHPGQYTFLKSSIVADFIR